MRIARPIAFLFIMALALALLHASSLDVFAQTDCVQSLNSVAVEGTWNGDCLSRNREDAYARYYTFSILRQSDVSITLESETDPYVFLLSGIGAEADYLAENDDIDAGSRNFNSRVTRTLEPGDYTIEATTYDAEAIGEFTLTVAGIGALDDRAALTAFYHATDGPNWRNSDNWLTDAPLSEWYGVYNTNADGRVTDLQLSSNYLSGQIPPDLGNLEELQVLSISGNQLTDIIPPELGKLVNLKHLRLDHNKLSGELPRTLTELTLLSGLYFGDNAGLCAPNTDEAFMAWLRGISEADGATCSPLPPSDERDLDGLKALYDATDGDNWSRRDNWFTDAPLAEWYGVTIDFDGRVSELNFDYNLLTGELPPELSNLTNLKRLSLGVNRLTGEIPHQLGELTNLIRIGLSSNQLAGSIPAELGNLTNLTGLYLGANLLAGDIPAELGRLTNLRVLYLDGNELTLSNEALSGISNLVNLEALGLANNRLSGEIPAEFSNLEKLVQLRLSNNQLTGEIPLELIRLANMELLQLGRNQLTGVIPSELGGLSNLEILELNENRLTGQIPDRLGDLTLLESLHLDSNQLTGDIPSALSDLTELDELYLAGNQLTGCIPALGDVKGNDFDELGLPFCVDTNPTPTVPDCVDQLPDDISVAGTWSTDCTSDIDAPSGRGDRYAKFYTFTLYAESDVTITLSSDEDAFLYLRTGTSTDGAALHENDDYNYPASTDSRIEETLEAGTYTIEATTYAAGVTGDFILTVNGIGPLDDRAALTALYNATGGDDWDDNDNWLTDAPLDEWYGVDTDEEGRVIVLDLAGNDLVGHIPPELGELSELEVLELNSNLLTGTLPPELGKLSELEHVELNNNLLTGTLPPELGKLSELEYLELSGNLLTGTLPPELGKLVKLTDFSVEANYLTGTIPPEIGGLASLEDLRLNGNRFWGELPHTLTALSRLRRLEYDENSGLCAPPNPESQEWLSSVARARGDTCVQPVAPPDEREIAALTAIYNATGGDDWFDRTNWFSDEPVQFWSGISVKGEGHITELRLSGNNLSGQIPAELSHLTSLKRLYLSTNQFTGTIPSELGLLTELERLYLSRNQLTGTIPLALGNLTNLKRLYLDDNQLTGSIPPELGKLADLESLEINDNRLTGQLPYELINLGILDTLYFSGNDGLCASSDAAFQDWLRTIPQVRGDTCVSDSEETDRAALTALYNATDGDNWFNNTNWITDAPLSEWHGVSTNNEGHVVSLYLGHNSLSEAVPPEIGGLINLSHLHLGFNQLTGTVPSELGDLTRLEFLNLSYNRLWGELPRGMTALTRLISLYSLSNSGLCVPDDAEFQEWLEAIPSGSVEVITCNPPSTTPDAGDLASLTTLYHATDGANWDDNTNWLSEQPLQYWKGVTINSEGRVTQLDLYGNQLSGDIPVELGNLADLEWLYLHYNQLSGDIPATLGRPTYLEVLDLSDNQLTGAIAPELASLTELRLLTLDRNQLTGEIPDWLGNMDLMHTLWLGNNNLTGAIPPELANLTELNSLHLGANQLTGEIPDWLGSLDQLVFLSVNDNQLTGAIPPELGSLHQLFFLLLDNNQLTGTIPPELSNLLPSLEELFLGGNHLTGCIPQGLRGVGTNDLDELGLSFCTNADREALIAFYNAGGGDNWTYNTNWLSDAPLNQWYGVDTDGNGRVTHLVLVRNNLSGRIPQELTDLTNVKHIDLRLNRLTGGIPSHLANFHNLEHLDLGLNELGGTIPQNIGKLTSLKYLDLSANGLAGAIPAELDNLAELESLDLAVNYFTGEIPSELGNLAQLESLRLYSNQLSGTIPPELGDMNSLRELLLLENSLSGPLPPELGKLTNLETLDISFNNLTGEIPSEFGDLTSLRSLLLYRNELTGEIPTELGDLPSLDGLYIYYNRLSGPIPPELGDLTNLVALDASNNRLSGAIPSELANAPHLAFLTLNNNQLSGQIPPELGNLSKNLVALWLHSNQFAGTIPSEFGNLDKLVDLNLSDNQFTGELPDELTELRELYSLLFDNNAGLCAPTDAKFQQWLQSIDIVEGPTCTDTTPTPTPEDPIPSECVNSLGGTPAEGTWTADCLSINRTENGVHYARYYSFTLDRRSQVDLTLESSTDPYLILLSETGEVLSKDDDDDDDIFDLSTRDSGIRITLDPGDYIVEATTYAGAATGDFTLTFSRSEMVVLRSLNNAADDSEYLETCKV